MPVPNGQKNHIVTLQQQKTTRDALGGEFVEWTDVTHLWAFVRQTGASSSFENDANIQQETRNATFRIFYTSEVSELDRIIHDGLVWDILGIAELGRRKELLVYAQTDVNRTP